MPKQQEMKQSTSLILIAILLIVAAALSVVLVYPQSFSPLIAISLFSGAVIKDKKLAVLIPVLALFLTDLLFEVSGKAIGFYGWAQIIDFATYAIIAVVGSFLVKRNIINIFLFTVLACITFYLVSNTAFFIFTNPVYHTYPQTFAGYLLNMEAAIPFMKFTVISTACYSVLFFGVYALSEKYIVQKQVA